MQHIDPTALFFGFRCHGISKCYICKVRFDCYTTNLQDAYIDLYDCSLYDKLWEIHQDYNNARDAIRDRKLRRMFSKCVYGV